MDCFLSGIILGKVTGFSRLYREINLKIVEGVMVRIATENDAEQLSILNDCNYGYV